MSGDTAAAAESKSGDIGDTELEEFATKLHDSLEIKTRKWLLTSYEKAFIGNEAVDKIIEMGKAASREEAVKLGNLLMSAGYFFHVTKDHIFKDEKLYYRFMSDTEHGTKEKNVDTQSDWSWGDLLTTFTTHATGDSVSLQSTLAPLSDEVTTVEIPKVLDGVDTFGVSPLDKHNQVLLDNVHPVKWVNPTPKKRYNIIAIGAGAGGLVSAAGTAGLGGVSAIIEENLFGGDCLNSGCVPSKALLACAKAASIVTKRADEFGIEFIGGSGGSGGDAADASSSSAPQSYEGSVRINFGKVMERMRRIRSKISYHDACQRFTTEYGMDVFLGRAEFISDSQIKVGDAVLEFSRCVIATGASPTAPPIPGLAEIDFLTNHTLWNLTRRPKSLIVLGAGPIGCEMAQALSLLGVEITVLNRSDRILGKEDPAAAEIVKAQMIADGVTFYTGLKFIRVFYTDAVTGEECKTTEDASAASSSDDTGGSGKGHGKINADEMISNTKLVNFEFTVNSTGEKKIIQSEGVLVATGRKPNVTNMGLEKANVKFNERSGVEVNDYLQTSNSSIYAVGDCCTRYQFTHMADAMARMVIRNALFFGRAKVTDLVVPWATYTFPEVAHVGLYERDLTEKKIDYDVHQVELDHNDRAICEGADYGFVKVLTKKGSDTILGATIVSDNAGDQISEITLAIQAGVGLGFIAGVIHPYPTVAEGIKQCGDSYNRTKLTPMTKALLRKILGARR